MSYTEVILDYDDDAAAASNIDLGALPFLKKVSREALTDEQQANAAQLGRCTTSERPKLVSTDENDHRRVDFVGSILFLLIHASFRIKEIKTIITYKHEALLAEYLQELQIARGKCSSPVQSKLIKALANSVPGYIID